MKFLTDIIDKGILVPENPTKEDIIRALFPEDNIDIPQDFKTTPFVLNTKNNEEDNTHNIEPDMSLVKNIDCFIGDDKGDYYDVYSYKDKEIFYNANKEGEYTVNWDGEDWWYSTLKDACVAIEQHLSLKNSIEQKENILPKNQQHDIKIRYIFNS